MKKIDLCKYEKEVIEYCEKYSTIESRICDVEMAYVFDEDSEKYMSEIKKCNAAMAECTLEQIFGQVSAEDKVVLSCFAEDMLRISENFISGKGTNPISCSFAVLRALCKDNPEYGNSSLSITDNNFLCSISQAGCYIKRLMDTSNDKLKTFNVAENLREIKRECNLAS